jgi:hypothetical protein
LTASPVPDFGPQHIGCVMVTEPFQVCGEVASRGQRARMVVAQDTAEPDEGVGVEVPGRLTTPVPGGGQVVETRARAPIM